AVFAVLAAQAIFGLERLAIAEGGVVSGEKGRAIFRVHALCPPEAELGCERAAGELEPRPVQVHALPIGSGKPDHDRRMLGHETAMLRRLDAAGAARRRR